MLTKGQLLDMDSTELNKALADLSEKTGEKLPKTGTNEEKRQRILTAQEMLELDQKSEEGEGDQPDLEEGSTQADDLDGKQEDKPEQTPESKSKGNSYHVSSVKKSGFYRCGLFFPHEGVDVELTDEQLACIQADKNLIIA